jgi:hypothetical protein
MINEKKKLNLSFFDLIDYEKKNILFCSNLRSHWKYKDKSKTNAYSLNVFTHDTCLVIQAFD